MVDYCAYDKDAIEVSLACLKESLTSFGCYVYISTGKFFKPWTSKTDSVYDASEYTLKFEQVESEAYLGYKEVGIPETLGYLDLDTLTTENKKNLKGQDDYGFKKLRAESYLMGIGHQEGF